MINVESFQAKLVSDSIVRETRRGPVCNMRVLQGDLNGRVFIDLAVFDEELVKKCGELVNGALLDVDGAGLVYNQWEAVPKGGTKPRKYSKHSLIAQSLALAE